MRPRRVLALAALLAAAAPPVPGRAADAPAPPPVTWTYADAVGIALERSPAVGQAAAEARAAGARVGQARAPRLPQVSAQASVAEAEAPSPATGAQTRSDAETVQATVSQLVTDFGRTRAGVDRAASLAAAAGEAGRSSRVEVAYAAGIAYLGVLRAEAVLEVAREAVRQRELLLRQARAFYDAGVRARIDVVRAEANHLQAKAAETAARHDVDSARRFLLNRIGVDGPADFALAGGPALAPPAGDAAAWRRAAEEAHPDLRAALLQVEAAERARRAAALGSAPAVSATGRLGWAGADFDLERSWQVGAQVSVPVFNGHLTREQEAEAEARLVAAGFALEDRRRALRLAVDDAARGIDEAAERHAAREKEREAFAENLRLATGRYEAGAGDIIEVVDAQIQLAAAGTNLAQAAFDRDAAAAALYRAVGRIP